MNVIYTDGLHRRSWRKQRGNERADRQPRLAGDTGSAVVTTLVLLLAMTGGASIWLTRDVGIGLSQSSLAHEIAFEVARHGAQQIDTDALRDGVSDTVVLDEPAVRRAVATNLERALQSRGATGRLLGIEIDGDVVIVGVVIDGGDSAAVAHAAARAVIGS